jgi:hypothetical protein
VESQFLRTLAIRDAVFSLVLVGFGLVNLWIDLFAFGGHVLSYVTIGLGATGAVSVPLLLRGSREAADREAADSGHGSRKVDPSYR